MTEMVQQVLKRWGQTVLVIREGEPRASQAFLQPAAEKQKAWPFSVTPLGPVDHRMWTYLGRTEVRPGDRVRWQDREFTVRNSMPYYLGEELSHWWATLSPAEEAAE